MRKEITFDNYVAMCDRFADMPFHCGGWWPSIQLLKTKIEPELSSHLEFLVWIAETADEPKTPEEKESRAYINELIQKTYIFKD